MFGHYFTRSGCGQQAVISQCVQRTGAGGTQRAHNIALSSRRDGGYPGSAPDGSGVIIRRLAYAPARGIGLFRRSNFCCSPPKETSNGNVCPFLRR
ncbi:hypothetical protein KCP74_03370 [Salmonella enterica subsp. enterica]|nr:hypothetical protein KCP74_03370 [Salmonella enterica subsp. enterica]